MRLWERGRLSVLTGRSSSNGPRRMAQPGCGCCSLGCAAWRFCGSRGSTRRRSQRSSWTRSDSAPPAGICSTQRPRDPISDRRSVIVDASNHVHAESVARSCRARFAWSAAARRQRAGQAPGVVDKGTRHAAHFAWSWVSRRRRTSRSCSRRRRTPSEFFRTLCWLRSPSPGLWRQRV